MSYLNNLRLTFAGKFQSDVSTVNNEVTHFDTAKFKKEYQEYGQDGGWWNPCGSGAFRLIDCTVKEVSYSDGTVINDAQADAAIGMSISGSNQRVSGKMVDLDPQMQMVSEIWGLSVGLTDAQQKQLFSGNFKPAPFRDIIFGRQQQSGGGDQNATAIYQSVIEDLSWVDDSASPFLKKLKAMVEHTGKLSIRMMLYSYNMTHTDPDFTLGYVSGVIGPYLEGEPDTFILGRRFAPQNQSSTAQNINFFNGQLELTTANGAPASGDLSIDLSNALPLLNGNGEFVNLGQIQLIVLKGDFNEGTTGLSPSLYDCLGDVIPYLDDQWLQNSGAVFTVNNIKGPTLQDLMGCPLALMKVDTCEILIRETQNGLLVRVDEVVHRVNPVAEVQVNFYAAQYGFPIQQNLTIALEAPQIGTVGEGPLINVPASALLYPKEVSTDETGKALYCFDVNNPDNPRKYIDGQVYLISYKPTGVSDYSQHMFDFIACLAFDQYKVPASPTWDDVAPIFTQYGNLYPVMSRMLVDLSSYASVKEYRSILELAFTRKHHDPNYMPVTRDLSAGKREMIIEWLTAKAPDGSYLLAPGKTGSTSEAPNLSPCDSCEIDLKQPSVSDAEAAGDEPIVGSKELATKRYKANSRSQG